MTTSPSLARDDHAPKEKPKEKVQGTTTGGPQLGGMIAELKELRDLHNDGYLTDEERDTAMAEIKAKYQ